MHAMRPNSERKRVPKIIVNNTLTLFFETAIDILVISNHNSVRVLFYEIAPVGYILSEKHIHILAVEMASPENQHRANCIGTLSCR